jgi:hypothetical protein
LGFNDSYIVTPVPVPAHLKITTPTTYWNIHFFKHLFKMSIFNTPTPSDPTVLALRTILTSESSPLAARFRALFSLKHLAALSPPTDQSQPALEAIAAALVSPSALLKHELAYCLGQSGKPEAVRFLEACVEDRAEDDMCRHEAAEALGALGFDGSLGLLKARRDDKEEVQVVRETAELAVERIEWAASDAGKAEKLRSRYVIHELEWKGLRGKSGRANCTQQRFRFYRPCATSC